MSVRRALSALIAILCSALGACSPSAEPAKPRKAAPPSPAAPTAPPPQTAPVTPAPRSFSDFRPSLHGFRFRNDFSGSPLPFSLGGLEKQLNLPNRFGLCGGMSFAAADFFLAHLEPPSLDKPPAHGQPLYDYLYSRQIESLGETLQFVPKFAKWMTLPDLSPSGTSALTRAGLPEILEHIQSGRPTLLGLVLTSAAKHGQLWQNHQVLAYAADTAPDSVVIHIYDPNCPHDDAAALYVAYCDARADAATPDAAPCPGVRVVRKARGHPDLPVRGFFLMPYTPKVPPANCR